MSQTNEELPLPCKVCGSYPITVHFSGDNHMTACCPRSLDGTCKVDEMKQRKEAIKRWNEENAV